MSERSINTIVIAISTCFFAVGLSGILTAFYYYFE